jgi:hypothetical protein
MKYTILIIIILSLYSCSSDTQETSSLKEKETISDSVKSVKDTFSIYPEMRNILNEKNSTPENNYYKLIPTTDSTCKIEWGNTKLKRISEDYHFHFVREIRLDWENTDFMVLKGSSEMDSWFNVILPLDSQSKVSDIWNPMAYNKFYNLIVEEGHGDTIVIVRNIKTGKSQTEIDSENSCQSPFNHYCIDSISILNKELYIKWAFPKKESGIMMEYEIRTKLKI